MTKTTKARKSSYGSFRSDTAAEVEGKVIDYGEFRVTIARAGGSNKAYNRLLESLTKPYRRAIQLETLPDAVSEKIMKEALAKAVVLNWELREVDEKTGAETWSQGIEDPDTGDVLPFNADNVLKVFQHPEVQNLYNDLNTMARKESLFLQTRREEEGNA